MPHRPGSIDEDLVPMAKALQMYRLERRTMTPDQAEQWRRSNERQDDTVRREGIRRGHVAFTRMAAMFRECLGRCDERIAFLKEIGAAKEDLDEEVERRADAATELEWIDEMITELELMA